MGGVVGAIRRAGAGTPGRVDQGNLRFLFAPAEMDGNEHACSPAAHDRDAHHDRMLYLAARRARDIAAFGPQGESQPPSHVEQRPSIAIVRS